MRAVILRTPLVVVLISVLSGTLLAQDASRSTDRRGVVHANGQHRQNPAGSIRQVAQRGILGRIIGGGSPAPKAKKDDDGRRVIEPVIPDEQPDWTGVPFHRAAPASAAKNNTPLADPSDPSNQGLGTLRDVQSRAQSQPSSESSTASSRRITPPSKPASLPQPSAQPKDRTQSPRTSRIPVPPSEAEVKAMEPSQRPSSIAAESLSPSREVEMNTSTFEPPSSSQSSRRSRRRAVEPLAVDIQLSDESANSIADSIVNPPTSNRRQQTPSTSIAKTQPAPAGQNLPSNASGTDTPRS